MASPTEEHGLPPEDGGGRFRHVRWLLLLLFVLTALLVLVRFNVEPVPLTSDEILDVEGCFDEANLTRLIGKSLMLLHNRNRREEVYARLYGELMRFDAASRHRIRVRAFALALADARREAALLPVGARSALPVSLARSAGEFMPLGPEEEDATLTEAVLAPVPPEERGNWAPVVAAWVRNYGAR